MKQIDELSQHVKLPGRDLTEASVTRALVLALALCVLGFAFLELGHLSNEAKFQAQAAVQSRANAAAIAKDSSILAEVRRDEAAYCAAAKLSGNPAIVAVVCPKGTAP